VEGKLKIIGCRICGNSLEGLHSRARFCSELCRTEAKRIRDRNRIRTRRGRHRKRNPEYLKRKRARRYARIRERLANDPEFELRYRNRKKLARQRRKIPTACIICGREIEITVHAARLTCSALCAAERKEQLRKPTWQPQEQNCVVCNNAFMPKSANTKCCSDECRSRRQYQLHRGYPRDYKAEHKRRQNPQYNERERIRSLLRVSDPRERKRKREYTLKQRAIITALYDLGWMKNGELINPILPSPPKKQPTKRKLVGDGLMRHVTKIIADIFRKHDQKRYRRGHFGRPAILRRNCVWCGLVVHDRRKFCSNCRPYVRLTKDEDRRRRNKYQKRRNAKERAVIAELKTIGWIKNNLIEINDDA